MKKTQTPRKTLASGRSSSWRCSRKCFANTKGRSAKKLANGRDLPQDQGPVEVSHRAVDKAGNTIDFLLRAHRDKPTACRFFEKAIG